MSRQSIPYQVEDISALARYLAKSAQDFDEPPSHVAWLNLLSKAAGYKNYQHFKAENEPAAPPQDSAEIAPVAMSEEASPRADATASEPVDQKLIEKSLRHINELNQLVHWPGKSSQVELFLWWLWSLFPAQTALTEMQVNALLKVRNSFDDHALLRRALIDFQFVDRSRDGASYIRKDLDPSPTAQDFIERMNRRQIGQPELMD